MGRCSIRLEPKETLWKQVADGVVQMEFSARFRTSGMLEAKLNIKVAKFMVKEQQRDTSVEGFETFSEASNCKQICPSPSQNRFLFMAPSGFHRGSRHHLKALQTCPCCFCAPVAASVRRVPLLSHPTTSCFTTAACRFNCLNLFATASVPNHNSR